MLDLRKITVPTLLLNAQKCRANIERLVQRAAQHNVQLAPHFKTHQSAQVSRWAQEVGIKAITVTSLKMATYFARHGWQDITIAFPLNVRVLPAIVELAKQIHLTVFINSEATAQHVAGALSGQEVDLHFYVEIDTGYHRSGVPYENTAAIVRILTTARPISRLHFVGFYTHAGHTYDTASVEEVKQIHQESLTSLGKLKKTFRADYPDVQLSLGDTPACSVAEDFTGISVIRPGNFMYYDLKQHSVGSSAIDDIAICLACPVVSVYPERNEAIVHGGWVHLGKDSLSDEDGPYFGQVVRLNADGWSWPVVGAKVRKVSQEHGVVSLTSAMITEVQVGDLLGVLPIHACATADAMRHLVTLNGERVEMMAK